VRARAFARGPAFRRTVLLGLAASTLVLGPVFTLLGGDDAPLAQHPLASSEATAWLWLALLAAACAAGIAAMRWRGAGRLG
jgi:hypothetical protein